MNEALLKEIEEFEVTDIAQDSVASESEQKSIILNLIKSDFAEDVFEKWIAPLQICAITKSEITFNAPSKFVRDWVLREFVENKSNKNNLLKTAKKYSKSIKKISVIAQEAAIKAKPENKKSANLVNLSKHDNVFSFGTDLNQKYTFDNFVSAKYNRFALKMARIAAGVENSQLDLFDEAIPLFIHGGVGMGKTHLAQAIAWHIKNSDNSKKVVYLSAEKFMFHFVKSVRDNNMMSFKEQFRSVDVLIIDDVQFIAGKKTTQEEFMHSFNHLVENNKQVILVCDRSPSDLESIDEKLKSRIAGGMIINFKKPDFNDRLELLKQKAQLLNIEIENNILELIASKLKLSIRDLDGAIRKLAANQILEEEKITVNMAQNVINEYDNSSNLEVDVKKIKKLIAAQFNIKISLLSEANRSKDVAHARQVAMYLAKTLTDLSLPKIGQEFKKNHATVIYAIKSVEKMIEQDDAFADKIESLKLQLAS